MADFIVFGAGDSKLGNYIEMCASKEGISLAFANSTEEYFAVDGEDKVKVILCDSEIHWMFDFKRPKAKLFGVTLSNGMDLGDWLSDSFVIHDLYEDERRLRRALRAWHRDL